jgi:hypothetical protein
LGRIFLFEGPEEAGFDHVPAGFVNLAGFQAVPPGLGRASEDAGQFSNFVAVIPGGNFCSDLDFVYKSASGGSLFAFISVKQGQVVGPFQVVMGNQGILEISLVQGVGHGVGDLVGGSQVS